MVIFCIENYESRFSDRKRGVGLGCSLVGRKHNAWEGRGQPNTQTDGGMPPNPREAVKKGWCGRGKDCGMVKVGVWSGMDEMMQ